MVIASLNEQMLQVAVDRMNMISAFNLNTQSFREAFSEALKTSNYSYAIDIIDTLVPDTSIDTRLVRQVRALIVAVYLMQSM